MTTKYDALFAPRDPSKLAADRASAAVPSVQSSLYGRLRREHGNSGAGGIAWMLIHAASPASRHHDAALEALHGRTRAELGSLLLAADGALGAAKTLESVTLARAVLESVKAAITAAMTARPVTSLERRAGEGPEAETGVGVVTAGEA